MAGACQRVFCARGAGVWVASGSIRSPAANGECSRPFRCEPGSRRSAGSKPATASGSRASTPASWRRSSHPREPGARSSWSCGSMSGSRPLVRTDAVARIVSEGLVGAKLVELTPGRPAHPVAELDMIASERPIEINDLMQKAAASLARLDAATQAAEKGLGELNAIAGSIHRGEGSLGKLIRDDSLHQKPHRSVAHAASEP